MLERYSINAIVFDSRFVEQGAAFFCAASLENGGQKYCEDALLKGAAVIVAQKDVLQTLQTSIPLIESIDVRRDLAIAAAQFYQSAFVFCGAVTGTNGKTSTAFYGRQMLEHLGFKALSVGTLGYIDQLGIHPMPQGLTTPDAVAFHKALQDYSKKGYDHMVCEASSHGLHQQRLAGLNFDVGVFTNLTQDHLDYHADMEAYLAAKSILFEERLHKKGTAILNADDAASTVLAQRCAARGIKTWFYGYKGTDFQIINLIPTPQGFEAQFKLLGAVYDCFIPLLGDFQVMNVLAAIAMIAVKDVALIPALMEYIPHIIPVPGRMEQIGGAPLYVDYAHTPDALQNVLSTIKKHVHGKLHVVFGCGGNRDPYKRPIMGSVAAMWADHVYVTDDNPRYEKPEDIRAAIMKGCPLATEIGGREKAIERAFATLQKGDILVVAGKGHESGQIIGDSIIPFRDGDVLLNLLRK